MKLTFLEIAIISTQIRLLMKWVKLSNKFKGTNIDLIPLNRLCRKLSYEKTKKEGNSLIHSEGFDIGKGKKSSPSALWREEKNGAID
jgi:hypothetical protein